MSPCWCGNEELQIFNADYGHCRRCGTLVLQNRPRAEDLRVEDDDTSFYGKQYWLGHQQEEFGYPDIESRARHDLTERNLHWLKALLKYQAPGGEAVELGCAHASFVALLQWAGWDASGVEMSPWVVEFGRGTFGVPIHVGPVEDVGFGAGTLQTIALMDVLEHLPDPVGTMRYCVDLLAPGGLLLIQTPQFREDMRYEVLVEAESPFLEQLKADEHLYLFSERAVRLLFERLGVAHLAFEPAIFAQYDMFFAASRAPLVARTEAEVEQSLLAQPSRRLLLALLDLRARELASEADRVARGEQIATLTSMVHEIAAREQAAAGQLAAAEADRAARGAQIATLTSMVHDVSAREQAAVAREQAAAGQLAASEADRAARGDQIAALTEMVHAAAAREQEAAARLAECDADRNARGSQIESLTRMVKESEADRALRGAQIETLTSMVHEAQAHQQLLSGEVTASAQRLRDSELARAAQDARVQDLTGRIRELEAQLRDTRSALALRVQRSAALSGELEVLLARPAFRRLAHLLRWQEATGLQSKIAENND